MDNDEQNDIESIRQSISDTIDSLIEQKKNAFSKHAGLGYERQIAVREVEACFYALLFKVYKLLIDAQPEFQLQPDVKKRLSTKYNKIFKTVNSFLEKEIQEEDPLDTDANFDEMDEFFEIYTKRISRQTYNTFRDDLRKLDREAFKMLQLLESDLQIDECISRIEELEVFLKKRGNTKLLDTTTKIVEEAKRVANRVLRFGSFQSLILQLVERDFYSRLILQHQNYLYRARENKFIDESLVREISCKFGRLIENAEHNVNETLDFSFEIEYDSDCLGIDEEDVTRGVHEASYSEFRVKLRKVSELAYRILLLMEVDHNVADCKSRIDELKKDFDQMETKPIKFESGITHDQGVSAWISMGFEDDEYDDDFD